MQAHFLHLLIVIKSP